MLLLTHLIGWLQPEATNVAAPAGPAAGGGGGAASGPSPVFNIALLGVMFVVMYFLMIRPQQKRQKEVDAMLKALKKGDKVRTSGGIRGEITEINDSDVTLLIADKVKVNVLRSHISSKAEAKPAPEGKGKA
ncbi:MAG: preprotein translocase subunit YajC [Myxococcales bacterium]|nr:preprotein translocase subunit YajC [Myxococcales bacterium]MDD9965827.1 preprotein translocase subunit YajC [Myxococcales bacterium]